MAKEENERKESQSKTISEKELNEIINNVKPKPKKVKTVIKTEEPKAEPEKPIDKLKKIKKMIMHVLEYVY